VSRAESQDGATCGGYKKAENTPLKVQVSTGYSDSPAQEMRI
jgi:hypothetical protein